MIRVFLIAFAVGLIVTAIFTGNDNTLWVIAR